MALSMVPSVPLFDSPAHARTAVRARVCVCAGVRVHVKRTIVVGHRESDRVIKSPLLGQHKCASVEHCVFIMIFVQVQSTILFFCACDTHAATGGGVSLSHSVIHHVRPLRMPTKVHVVACRWGAVRGGGMSAAHRITWPLSSPRFRIWRKRCTTINRQPNAHKTHTSQQPTV